MIDWVIMACDGRLSDEDPVAGGQTADLRFCYILLQPQHTHTLLWRWVAWLSSSSVQTFRFRGGVYHVCVCVSGVYPTHVDYRGLTVERSGLAETLVMSLALMENQLSVKLRLLQTLQILSRTSGDHTHTHTPEICRSETWMKHVLVCVGRGEL